MATSHTTPQANETTWPGVSAEKVRRKTRQINAWRSEVADAPTACACSGSCFVIPADSGSGSGGAAGTPKPVCTICRLPEPPTPSDESFPMRQPTGMKRLLQKISPRRAEPQACCPTEEEQPVTKMYKEPRGTGAGEPSGAGEGQAGEEEEGGGGESDEGSERTEGNGHGLRDKEARLRRAQRLLARSHAGAATTGATTAGATTARDTASGAATPGAATAEATTAGTTTTGAVIPGGDPGRQGAPNGQRTDERTGDQQGK